MTIYRGFSGVNRTIKQQFRGLGGVNREVKEQYRGYSGANRKVFSSAVSFVGAFGSLGSYSLQADKIVITVGSPTGENIAGYARFNTNIPSGSSIQIEWACTYRAGASGFLLAVVRNTDNYTENYNKTMYGTWSRTTDTVSRPIASSYLDIGIAKTGGSNQVGTLEIYNIKVNGVQIFPI